MPANEALGLRAFRIVLCACLVDESCSKVGASCENNIPHPSEGGAAGERSAC